VSEFWDALQQSICIAYGSIILWALGAGIAAATLLAVAAVIGRITGKYIK